MVGKLKSYRSPIPATSRLCVIELRYKCVPVLINASDVSFGVVLQCSIWIDAPTLVAELTGALGSSHFPVALCHKWVLW